MAHITVYRHKDCARCARIARFQGYLNWLGQVRYSTAEPPCGPLQLGEIAVEDSRTGAITKGVTAVRQIFRQLPPLWPFLPLLWLPPLARRIDRDVRRCGDGACGVSHAAPAGTARDAEPGAADQGRM